MEMANQMLAEIKAAAKRKTLESKSSSNSRISKQQQLEKVDMDAPLPAVPVSSPQQVDEELSSQLSSSVTISSPATIAAPIPLQKTSGPVVVPQTPPSMYNQNPLNNQSHQQGPPSQPQPYYSPQQQHQQPGSPMSMPQPQRVYSQNQQQRPAPPSLPTHHQQQQPSYGYNGPPQGPQAGGMVNVDPRYQQQQQQQMYYQQQQQNRPPMGSPYSPYQQLPPQQQQIMGRPQPNPNYYPPQQQPPQQPPQQQMAQVNGVIFIVSVLKILMNMFIGTLW
jgi:hypothetical protein